LATGWNAVVIARKIDQVKHISEGYYNTAVAISLDVTDKTNVAEAIETAEDKFGKIDVLVNNAGYGYFTSIEEGGRR
jgi:NADP-dependent 3-hydroxy acid dehydrogenase YdfG